MNKKLTFYITLFLLPVIANSQVLQFIFFNSSNQEYKTNNLPSGTHVLLIETPTLDNVVYLKQNKLLSAAAHGFAEDLKLMYVVSCWTEEYTHGYHTTTAEAKRITGKNDKFRIRLLNENGAVYAQFNMPVSAKLIRQTIKEIQ